jgi:hypothetical protein
MQSLAGESTLGATTDMNDQMSYYQGSKAGKSYITSPVCSKKPIKVLHLTAPDDKLTKQLFKQAAKETPQHHTFATSSMTPNKPAA